MKIDLEVNDNYLEELRLLVEDTGRDLGQIIDGIIQLYIKTNQAALNELRANRKVVEKKRRVSEPAETRIGRPPHLDERGKRCARALRQQGLTFAAISGILSVSEGVIRRACV